MNSNCSKSYIGLVSLFLFILYVKNSYAQERKAEDLIEQLVEQLADEMGDEQDYDAITDRLLYYYQFKINLNRTQGEELKELSFLFPAQIESLLNHRKLAGPFLSINEIQAIEGFDLLTVERLMPFVRISDASDLENIKLKDWAKEGQHDLMLRYGRALQLAEGYKRKEDSGKSRYLGSPDRYFIRYRYQVPRQIQVAINMKKDAGEQFFKGAQASGFDFYSASLHLHKVGGIQDIVIGDYSLQFGQGLNLWSGRGFGKGSLIQNTARQAMGVRPHTSSNEVLFFRGLAGTINLKSFKFSPFISYRKLDASLNEDSFTTLGQSGYHRTSTEVANRKSVAQFLYGIDFKYERAKLTVGTSIYRNQFDKTLIPAPRLYNKYNFSGSTSTNVGLYYNYTWRGTYLYGELAHILNGGYATVNGLITSLSHDFSLVLLHRNYQKDYFSFYNQSFAENSDARNENGFYSGLKWSPNRKLAWTLYADYFKFPWLKFRVDAPSHGYDMFSLFSYRPTRKTDLNIRYRYRNKEENTGLDETINFIEHVLRHQARFEVKYSLGQHFSFRNRFEFNTYKKGIEANEKGMMFYQDIIYKPMMKPISGNIRFAIFNTDSYQSRVYAFENNVLYGYSFPSYFNKGLRVYGNLRYKLSRTTDFWIHYGSFFYNRAGLGSGLDALNGKVKSDLRLQLRIQV